MYTLWSDGADVTRFTSIHYGTRPRGACYLLVPLLRIKPSAYLGVSYGEGDSVLQLKLIATYVLAFLLPNCVERVSELVTLKLA